MCLLSGNQEHCKRLKKMKFLRKKARLNAGFCKKLLTGTTNPSSALCIYDISSMTKATACPLSRSK